MEEIMTPPPPTPLDFPKLAQKFATPYPLEIPVFYYFLQTPLDIVLSTINQND
jgi:hypothetical protein